MFIGGQFRLYRFVARPDPVFTVGQFRSYRIVARQDPVFTVGQFHSYRIVARRILCSLLFNAVHRWLYETGTASRTNKPAGAGDKLHLL